jgi:hypothetical protein
MCTPELQGRSVTNRPMIGMRGRRERNVQDDRQRGGRRQNEELASAIVIFEKNTQKAVLKCFSVTV